MTEEEAKTKWCPFVRATNSGSERTFNRWSLEPITDTPLLTCCGSDCMAWRWSHPMGAQQIGHGPGAASTTVEDTTQFSGGYCGLAGKP